MAINLGATFDDQLLYQIGQTIATEVRAFSNVARSGLSIWSVRMMDISLLNMAYQTLTNMITNAHLMCFLCTSSAKYKSFQRPSMVLVIIHLFLPNTVSNY